MRADDKFIITLEANPRPLIVLTRRRDVALVAINHEAKHGTGYPPSLRDAFTVTWNELRCLYRAGCDVSFWPRGHSHEFPTYLLADGAGAGVWRGY